MGNLLDRVDHVGGRIYTRALALVLATAAVVVLVSGMFIIRSGGTVFGLLWLAGGCGFGLLARRLWRSRATLSDAFDGHG
jgi:hypothetical protein